MLRHAIAALAVFAALPGCSGDTETTNGDAAEDDAIAVEGQETVASESDVQSLTIALVAAAAAEKQGLSGDGAKASFTASCLTVTPDPDNKTATFVLTDCEGPFGLRRVTGTVTIGFAGSTANRLVLATRGTNLKVNRSTVSIESTATLAVTGRMRELSWQATVDATTPGGRSARRTVQSTLTWSVGEACIAAASTSTGTVDGRSLSVTLENYRRCRAACPEAGSKVTVTTPRRTVVVDYDSDGSVYRTAGKVRTKLPRVCGT